MQQNHLPELLIVHICRKLSKALIFCFRFTFGSGVYGNCTLRIYNAVNQKHFVQYTSSVRCGTGRLNRSSNERVTRELIKPTETLVSKQFMSSTKSKGWIPSTFTLRVVALQEFFCLFFFWFYVFLLCCFCLNAHYISAPVQLGMFPCFI